MNSLELNNHGERLVPGYSHYLEEVIRHKSSYEFYKKIIENDVCQLKTPINILEIGCGTGHGTNMLSKIENCTIFAIDIDEDAIEFARKNFSAQNVSFEAKTLDQIPHDKKFDYIISRHSFEHIEGIFSDVLKLRPNCRIMANVPYKEKPGNEFHFYLNIDEEMFSLWPNAQFFYEDLKGQTFNSPEYPSINSIVCISTFNTALSDVAEFMSFPFAPWKPNYAETLAYEELPATYRQLSTLRAECTTIQAELATTQAELAITQAALADAQRVLNKPIIRTQRKLWRLIKFWK